MKNRLSLLLLITAACGDDHTITPDGLPSDAPDNTFVAPAAVQVPISSTGPDRLLGVAAAPTGGFYAVGFFAPSVESTSDSELALVKLTTAGMLDTSFGGGDGIATLNGQVGGNAEVWRGIAVQPSGKIVVSGVVEDEITATDRDIVIARFTAEGTLDTTFGEAGVRRLDLSTAVGGTMGLDSAWGLATDPTGLIYVHAGQRAEGVDGGGAALTDTDFVVVRLTAEGAVDATFGTDGKHVLDIQRSNASVRGIAVLGDGNILANGYANSVSTGSVQPVLYRLTPTGTLDPTFASGGLFHDVVLTAQTEVYGIAIQPDGKLVTAGYGRNDPTGTNDWISLRFTANGVLDGAWADGGKYLLDPTGMNIADNCRDAIALPNGRTALVGSGGPARDTSDAYIVILDNTGTPDSAFGTGILKYDLGGNDAFFGGAVSQDRKHVLIAGFKGGGESPSASSNDDSHVVSIALQ